MASGPVPSYPLHYLVTLLDAGAPRLFEVRGTPEEDGYCMVVTPGDGSPSFDFWLPFPQGIFIRYLNKIIAAR